MRIETCFKNPSLLTPFSYFVVTIRTAKKGKLHRKFLSRVEDCSDSHLLGRSTKIMYPLKCCKREKYFQKICLNQSLNRTIVNYFHVNLF
jgi:hypothetical protein